MSPAFQDGTWWCYNCWRHGRKAQGLGGIDGLKTHQDRAECVVKAFAVEGGAP